MTKCESPELGECFGARKILSETFWLRKSQLRVTFWKPLDLGKMRK